MSHTGSLCLSVSTQTCTSVDLSWESMCICWMCMAGHQCHPADTRASFSPAFYPWIVQRQEANGNRLRPVPPLHWGESGWRVGLNLQDEGTAKAYSSCSSTRSPISLPRPGWALAIVSQGWTQKKFLTKVSRICPRASPWYSSVPNLVQIPNPVWWHCWRTRRGANQEFKVIFKYIAMLRPAWANPKAGCGGSGLMSCTRGFTAGLNLA